MPIVTLIAPPEWAHAFYRSVDKAFGDENLNIALAQRDAMLAVVHQVVQNYVDDPSLTFEKQADGFPSRDKLTGEYYIGREHYWVNDEPWFHRVGRKREYRFSFEVRCLEHLWHKNKQDQDYLGLEIHFEWIPESATFRYHGDVDSSAI